MKPGIPLLIIGGVLLAVGLVIAGVSTFSVTKQVLEGSTIIDSTSLEPNLSIVAVLADLPAGQQLLLSLSGDPTDVPLQARLTQPDGTVLTTYDINETPFTGPATTEISGDHTLEIKNVGSRSVTISGALLNLPIGQQGGGVSVQDNPTIQNLIAYGIGILVGIVLIIAGIVCLIIGAVKYVGARKTPQGTSSTTH
ncbi:hypothetical protein [Nitrososphaera sp.]|uniref:hypothetical protein n=1 Tax=Nitrososphaera sp. TaxID=1971748 RepID=UPI002EDB042C